MSRAIVQLVVVLSFLSTPLVTEAQQPGQPARRGIIYGAKPDFTPESNVVEQSFVEGLAAPRLPRGAEGKPERYPPLAAELVRAGVDVILAGNTAMAVAARNTTRTIWRRRERR